MKFAQRSTFSNGPFVQSTNTMPNKNKFFNTTKSSFPTSQYRLPQLNRSFSSTTAKSAKQKVAELDEKVMDLSKKVIDLRLQTRESRRYANFLKQDLGERQLQQHKQNLLLKINKLDKMTKLIRGTNEERTQNLKDDCQRLNDSSIHLQQLMSHLLTRTDTIQQTMGIYSGKQKHKK